MLAGHASGCWRSVLGASSHPTLLIALKKELAYRVFLLLYGMPAPSAERQHPEAWPASTYGHLREVLDSGALNDHWALSRLGHWVHVALSRQALGHRGSRSSGTQTQNRGDRYTRGTDTQRWSTNIAGGRSKARQVSRNVFPTLCKAYMIKCCRYSEGTDKQGGQTQREGRDTQGWGPVK